MVSFVLNDVSVDLSKAPTDLQQRPGGYVFFKAFDGAGGHWIDTSQRRFKDLDQEFSGQCLERSGLLLDLPVVGNLSLGPSETETSRGGPSQILASAGSLSGEDTIRSSRFHACFYTCLRAISRTTAVAEAADMALSETSCLRLNEIAMWQCRQSHTLFARLEFRGCFARSL